MTKHQSHMPPPSSQVGKLTDVTTFNTKHKKEALVSPGWLKVTHISLFVLVQCPIERFYVHFQFDTKKEWSSCLCSWLLLCLHNTQCQPKQRYPSLNLLTPNTSHIHIPTHHKKTNRSIMRQSASEKKTFFTLNRFSNSSHPSKVLCVRG